MAAVNMQPPSGLDMSPALRACPAFAADTWFDQKASQLLAWVWCCLTELSTMSTEKQNEVMANHYETLVKELRPEEFPDGTASTSNVEKLLDQMRTAKGKGYVDFRAKTTRDRSFVRDRLYPILNKEFPTGFPSSGKQLQDVILVIRKVFWDLKEDDRIKLAAARAAAPKQSKPDEGTEALARTSTAGRPSKALARQVMPAGYYPKLLSMVLTVVRLSRSPLRARTGTASYLGVACRRLSQETSTERQRCNWSTEAGPRRQERSAKPFLRGSRSSKLT
jgi:hypothetical protein